MTRQELVIENLYEMLAIVNNMLRNSEEAFRYNDSAGIIKETRKLKTLIEYAITLQRKKRG